MYFFLDWRWIKRAWLCHSARGSSTSESTSFKMLYSGKLNSFTLIFWLIEGHVFCQVVDYMTVTALLRSIINTLEQLGVVLHGALNSSKHTDDDDCCVFCSCGYGFEEGRSKLIAYSIGFRLAFRRRPSPLLYVRLHPSVVHFNAQMDPKPELWWSAFQRFIRDIVQVADRFPRIFERKCIHPYIERFANPTERREFCVQLSRIQTIAYESTVFSSLVNAIHDTLEVCITELKVLL